MKCNEHLAKIGSICCQKIIPLVFDQSYSYYEQICAFATKLNEIICAVNEQNLTIADFENRISTAFDQYKSEMNLAFADFQIEVNEKIDEFTTEIRDEWRIYRETLNLEFTELKNANQQFKTDMQTAWATYQNTLNAQWTAYKNGVEEILSTFDTNINQTIAEFSDDIRDFKADVNAELSQYSTADRLSYYGSLRPISAGSSTDWPFITNPIESVQGLSFANNLVSVYVYNSTTHKYDFLKRQKYSVLSGDSDIPTPTRLAPVLITFDNPVTNLFFAYGSDLVFTGTPTETGINRLVVGAFPRVAETMEVDVSKGYAPLAEYHTSGQGAQDLQPYTTPYPVQPSYYAIAFILFGVGVDVTVTQPTTAATQRRIMPGLLYDAFTGEFMRDPDVIKNSGDISTYNYYLRNPSATIISGDDLHDFKTPGRFACNTGSIAQGVVNSPYTSSGYRLEVIESTGNNIIHRLIPNSLSLSGGKIFMETYTASSDSWSSWYEFTGTQV